MCSLEWNGRWNEWHGNGNGMHEWLFFISTKQIDEDIKYLYRIYNHFLCLLFRLSFRTIPRNGQFNDQHFSRDINMIFGDIALINRHSNGSLNNLLTITLRHLQCKEACIFTSFIGDLISARFLQMNKKSWLLNSDEWPEILSDHLAISNVLSIIHNWFLSNIAQLLWFQISDSKIFSVPLGSLFC